MFGRARSAGRDQKTVVFGALSIALLHLRIINYRPCNGRLQVVDHHTIVHAFEKLEAVAMELKPGANPLIKHRGHRQAAVYVMKVILYQGDPTHRDHHL